MQKELQELQLGTLYRSEPIDSLRVDEAARTVELSFSSELPVERYFGNEVLDHSEGSVKMDRLRGGAPLLVEHSRGDQIGVIEKAWLADKRGQAIVRFGKSTRAEEIFQDVKGGIRRLVSVGYRVYKMTRDKIENDVETLRAVSWEPMEISIVSVPADPTVGVGRSDPNETRNIVTILEDMKSSPVLHDKAPEGGGAPEPRPAIDIKVIEDRARAAIEDKNKEICAIAFKVKKNFPARAREMDELMARGLSGDVSLADYRTQSFDLTTNNRALDLGNPAEAKIGMSERDLSRYSFQRAIAGMVTGKLDGLELECHKEALKNRGDLPLQNPQSVLIPYDVLSFRPSVGQRDQLVATGSIGGNLVATNLLASSFIDVLRNRMMVARLGATVLPGLVGNVAIPRQGAAATVTWQASEAATHTEGSITLQQVTLAPKQIAAKVDYSWLLLQQSTPQIDQIIRNDLVAVIARGIDLAALHGSGASGQPTGLISQSGVGSVALGTNGGTVSWASVVSLETAVATANADLGSLAYLTNAKQRGTMKTVERTSATGIFLWQDGAPINDGIGMVNGYPAGVSNQVASNLTKGTATTIASAIFFGDWSSLLIGQWGGLELLANPYAQTQTRIVELHAWQFVDIACRHGESFAVIADAL